MLRITATLALASSLAAAESPPDPVQPVAIHAALEGTTWVSPTCEYQYPLVPEGQTQLRFKRKFEFMADSWKGTFSWYSDSDCAVSTAGPAAAGGVPTLAVEGNFTLTGPSA